jgi:hypothetical protein
VATTLLLHRRRQILIQIQVVRPRDMTGLVEPAAFKWVCKRGPAVNNDRVPLSQQVVSLY